MQTTAPTDARHPRGASLGRRISLIVATGAVLMMLSLIAVGALDKLRLAEKLFDDAIAGASAQEARSIAGAVKFGRAEVIEESLTALAEEMDLTFRGALAVDASGATVTAFGEPDPASARLAREALKSGEPVRDGALIATPMIFGEGADMVGVLVMSWSDAAIVGEVKAAAWTGAILWGGALLLAAAGLAYWLGRVVDRPLRALEGSIGRLMRGETVELPGLDRRDEVGGLARAMERVHAAGLAADRTRRAIDYSSALLMIADVDDRIAYISPALKQLFIDEMSEVRRTLPDFDPDRIEGESFDQFHKDATHQRRMMADLKKSHVANIRLGSMRMRLSVNPVTAEDGRRLGTVVEWRDLTSDLALLEEIDAVAAAAAAGTFDRRVTTESATPELQRVAAQVNRISETVDGFLSDVEGPIEALAEGDLTRRCRGGHAGRFGEVTDRVNGAVERISSLASDILAAERGMRGSIGEVSGGAGDLSARTEAQASALEETSATVEQISATISSNADSASAASGLAAEARRQAESGRAVVENAVTSMKEIEESSSRIGDITQVIDSIAFQTNLLALNAAVEAARAGDAGKGFAVVASEVRTLTQRSSAAARDIKELIAASAGKVSDGMRHVHASGEALGGLEQAIRHMSETIDDIARASAEQATGMQEITAAVSHMDETTQRNAALAEASARAADALRRQAEQLTALVAFFRTEAENARRAA